MAIDARLHPVFAHTAFSSRLPFDARAPFVRESTTVVIVPQRAPISLSWCDAAISPRPVRQTSLHALRARPDVTTISTRTRRPGRTRTSFIDDAVAVVVVSWVTRIRGERRDAAPRAPSPIQVARLPAIRAPPGVSPLAAPTQIRDLTFACLVLTFDRR